MTQALSQTRRSTFVRGLLTEFSELNFPEDASIDELNCSLFQAGNRSRRLGLEYETGSSLSTETFADGTLFGTHTWANVGRNPDIEYLVVQAGAVLHFYTKGEAPLSGNKQTFTVNMVPFERLGGLGAAASHIDVTSAEGRLIVVSPQIEAFYIEKTSGGISTTQIDFKVRDFGFYGDPDIRSDKVSPDSSATVARQYDTKNCGWIGDKGDAALTSYISTNTAYPPLTHPWYSGKDSSGNFSVTEWEKIYTGNTVTANGHFILDLFNPNRDAASGLSGVEYFDGDAIESPELRFNSVTSFAGRVFFSGIDSRVYFTQLLDGIREIGNLYQVNDPTSEEISDLLDTDGGWVNIPEASGIRKLHVIGSSLLVFAKNGVWRISGVDGVFRATEFSVYKVTDNGLAQRRSLVAGRNGIPFWWGFTGIHTIQVTDDGGLVEVDISKDTIQTFWDEISSTAKGFVTGEYDSFNDRVSWFYPNDGETVEYKLNNVLFLDVSLGAFYPWKVSDKETGTPQIVGTSFFDGAGAEDVVFNVVDSSGNQVQDSSGNDVTVTRAVGSISSSLVNVLVKDSSGSLTFAGFTGTDFLDWNDANYDSYAESAYNFIGDLTRKKNSPYVTVLLRTTETGWQASGNGYTPVRNSSCKVLAYWDFKKEASSSAQEAYRFKHPLVVDSSDLSTFDYPTTVISTRLRTRGRGRVVRLRFQSSEGKDFNLLGWETVDAANRII